MAAMGISTDPSAEDGDADSVPFVGAQQRQQQRRGDSNTPPPQPRRKQGSGRVKAFPWSSFQLTLLAVFLVVVVWALLWASTFARGWLYMKVSSGGESDITTSVGLLQYSTTLRRRPPVTSAARLTGREEVIYRVYSIADSVSDRGMVAGSIIAFILLLMDLFLVVPSYLVLAFLYIWKHQGRDRSLERKMFVCVGVLFFSLCAAVTAYASLRPYATTTSNASSFKNTKTTTASPSSASSSSSSPSASASSDEVPFAGFSYWWCFAVVCAAGILSLVALLFHGLEMRARYVISEKLRWKFRNQ